MKNSTVKQEFIKDSVIGKIYFRFEDYILVKVKYLGVSDEPVTKNTNQSIDKVLEFLQDANTDLSKIKLKLNGTDFQKSVWRAIAKIPLGSTETYGSLADKIGSHPRPVANALRNNPLPIIYPCHRVLSATGIGGFSGQTQGEMIEIKRKLLKHEGAPLATN
jgi:methylated-DNA-[protein]-cysteine S-methyltransferase